MQNVIIIDNYIDVLIIIDVGTLCGNITEPRYLRSPKMTNMLTVMCY